MFRSSLLLLALLTAAPVAADELQLRKEAEAFKYPGAVGVSESQDVYRARLNTSDSVEDVLKWHEKQSGVSWSEKWHKCRESLVDVSKDGTTSRVFQNDSTEHNKGKANARTVSLYSYTERTPSHVLVVVISRATGDESTHLTLTYIPAKK